MNKKQYKRELLVTFLSHMRSDRKKSRSNVKGKLHKSRVRIA
jgi:hypothetical protein